MVKITNIVPEGPDQNALFGDDLFVMGVDAPTSFAVHRIENPTGSEGVFVNADTTFTIDQPTDRSRAHRAAGRLDERREGFRRS